MNELNFSKDEFSGRLDQIQTGLNKGEWVDDRLDVVKKDHGFLRFLKVIILPLARLFGKDPFGHVRVNKVAVQIMAQYNKHHDNLSAKDRERIANILTTLKNKTGNKYANLLDQYIVAINRNHLALIPPDPSAATGATPAPATPAGAPPPPPPPPVLTKEKQEQQQRARLARSLQQTIADKSGNSEDPTNNPVQSWGTVVSGVQGSNLFQRRQAEIRALPTHVAR